MRPCQCCNEKKQGVINHSGGYSYNRLEGDARDWAKDRQVSRSEYCVPVKGGNRFKGPTWQQIKCGDGRMGFSTRRKGKDEVRIEVGQDGQFKKSRKTLVRMRSARATASRIARRVDGSKCGLVSSSIIKEIGRDPVVVAKHRQVSRKFNRAQNRNNKARRGLQRATKLAA